MAEENTNETAKGFGEVTTGIFNKFSKMFGQSAEVNKQVRKELSKLVTQTQFTQQTVMNNRDKLEEVAQNDPKVANFLETFDKTNFGILNELKEATLSGQKISKELGKESLALLQDFESSLEGLELSGLEVSIGQLSDQILDTLQDGRFDRDVQRGLIQDLVAELESQNELTQEQADNLAALKAMQEEGLNFSEQQNDQLQDIFRFFKDDEIAEQKARGTLSDLNRKFGNFLTNQEEIKNALEDNQFDGESLADLLKEGLDSSLGGGLFDFIFAALGLPGFARVIGTIGDAFKGVTKFVKNIPANLGKIFGKQGRIAKLFGKIGKLFKPVGKLFEGIGKIFGGIGKIAAPVARAGKFLKVIPVVGTIIAAISGIFDAITGFFNADEISGKQEELVTIGDRVQASISSLLSGITFGFVKAQDIFQFIDKSIEKIFGEEGLIVQIKDFFTNLVDKIANFNFLEFVDNTFNSIMDSAMDIFTSLESAILDPILKIVDAIKSINVLDFVPDTIKEFFGDKIDNLIRAKDKAEEFSDFESSGFTGRLGADAGRATPRGRVDNAETLASTSQVALKREERENIERGGGSKAAVIPVPVSAQPAIKPVTRRKASAGDLTLGILNTSLLD